LNVLGIALVLGDDISTDAIIAGKYCRMADLERLAPHALESVVPDLAGRVKRAGAREVKRAGAGKGNHARGRMLGAGLVIVAGRNFGVGSSREQAPIALKAAGISAVVAGSFGRIFFRNAINLGLPVLKCPGAADAVKDGETVTVDIAGGIVRRGRGAPVLECEPLPPFLLEILEDGGLVAHVRRRFPYGKT